MCSKLYTCFPSSSLVFLQYSYFSRQKLCPSSLTQKCCVYSSSCCLSYLMFSRHTLLVLVLRYMPTSHHFRSSPLGLGRHGSLPGLLFLFLILFFSLQQQGNPLHETHITIALLQPPAFYQYVKHAIIFAFAIPLLGTFIPKK